MSGANETQYVTLSLGREVFAVPVAYVCEILNYQAPFALPEGPAWLAGLIDVRERSVPVIDLRVKLGLPKVPPGAVTRIMIVDVPLEGRSLMLGLIADRVLEVISVADDQVEPAPDVGVRWRSDYIAGVVRHKGDFVVLFELKKIITAAEVASMAVADEACA